MLNVTGETHKGAVRKQNQDVFRCGILDTHLCYALVCDGMGGEKAGDVASKTAADLTERYLKQGLSASMDKNSIRALLITAVSAANALIYDGAQKKPEYSGMGTTLEAAVILENTLYYCHVGDSRIYLVSGGSALQITHDHSMVQMLVDKGELSPDEAKTHPQKHYITRAVGVAPRVDTDYGEMPFSAGQTLLLCSDGLSNYFGHIAEVAPLVSSCLRAGSAKPLIDYALGAGGADNITAVLVCNS